MPGLLTLKTLEFFFFKLKLEIQKTLVETFALVSYFIKVVFSLTEAKKLLFP